MSISRFNRPAKLLVGASLLALALPAYAAPKLAPGTNRIVGDEQQGGSKAAAKEDVVCKRINSTTSLVKWFRACHSKSDWNKIERGNY